MAENKPFSRPDHDVNLFAGSLEVRRMQSAFFVLLD